MGLPDPRGLLLAPPVPSGLLEDRAAAGRELAALLSGPTGTRPVVLAIPRGGAPVAAEIADRLGAERDVLIARKIGAPRDPEYGLGAVAEGGVRFLDRQRIRAAGLRESDLERQIRAEEAEVLRRAAAFRRERGRVDLHGREAILVDDGVATGGTVLAAIDAARRAGADPVTVALGVCPASTAERLRRRADRVVVLLLPEGFEAVGQWYRAFSPIDDSEVDRYLRGRGS